MAGRAGPARRGFCRNQIAFQSLCLDGRVRVVRPQAFPRADLPGKGRSLRGLSRSRVLFPQLRLRCTPRPLGCGHFDEFIFSGDHKMLFYPQERIALFVDGANLYGAAKGLQFDIDYKRLLELFARKGILVRAFYYTAVAEDQEFSPLRPLIDWLDYNGFSVVTKPLKEFTDAQGRRRVKGNMDVELAIDVMDMAACVDHVVIFSGDGDFRRLVEAVQRKGRRVSVVSTIRTQPPMVADELRRQADNFIELEELKPMIMREGGPRSAMHQQQQQQQQQPPQAAAQYAQ